MIRSAIVLELAAWAITAAILALDTALPSGYAVGVLYVGVALAALWIPRSRFVFVYGAVATGLIIVGHAVSPTGGDPSLGVFNCAMSLGALWVTVGGLTLYRRAREARSKVEAMLAERAALSELGKMAAVIAHETRNALMGVAGVVQALDGMPTAGIDRATLQAEAKRRLDALGHTIDDLMIFTSVVPPVPVPVPLDELIAAAVARVRARPDTPGFDARVDVEPIVVSVDRDQMTRVIFNLVLNATQAMGNRGEVVIGSRVRNGSVELRISDTGPGIASAVRARLFEPFFSTKSRGNGLGLAFARRVVQAHGGSVEVSCPPTGGTVAVVTLPVGGSVAPAAVRRTRLDVTLGLI